MNINKIHHIAVISSDYKRSLDFYTRILGLRIIAEHYREERKSYKTDLALGSEYIIELFSFPEPPARLTHPEAAVRELDNMQISHEPIRIDEYTQKRFVFFQDPDGLPIELYEKD